jgi:DNA modification methylase
MENTPGEFIEALMTVFREVKRVLRSDGTCWINLGDSYAGSGKSGSTKEGRAAHKQFNKIETNSRQVAPTKAGAIYPAGYQPMAPGYRPTGTLKGKDLIGTPWMLAFAMREDGYYLRSDIIWKKVSCAPESVKDRPSRSHEHIFMFSKSRQYFYDIEAIRQDSGANARDVWTIGLEQSPEKHYAQFCREIPRRVIRASTSHYGVCSVCGVPFVRELVKYRPSSYVAGDKDERAIEGWGKDVVTGKPLSTNRPLSSIYRDTQQSKIITGGWKQNCDCNSTVAASVVMDPFGGSCTTGLVAAELGRSAIMIDIKEEYLQMGHNRLKNAGFIKCLTDIVYI